MSGKVADPDTVHDNCVHGGVVDQPFAGKCRDELAPVDAVHVTVVNDTVLRVALFEDISPSPVPLVEVVLALAPPTKGHPHGDVLYATRSCGGGL